MLTGCGCGPHAPLLLRGADAAASLLRDVFGIHVGARDAVLRKAAEPANPLTKPGFVATIREIAGALAQVTEPADRAALDSALRKLEGRDWHRLSEEQQGKAIEQAMGAIVGVPAIVGPKVRDVLQAAGKDVVLGTKAHGAKAWELDITPTFEAVDLKVVAAIANSQAFYLRNEYGKRSDAWSAVGRQIVADGVRDGLDKYDIAKNMKAALDGTSAQRSEGYYRMVASVFAARARSWGTLSSFEEAGIEEYQISEAIDEVSCMACRLMDGRTFSVASAMGGFQKIAESSDPESVVEHQPFLGTTRREDGGLAITYRAGGERHTVAQVEESAVGQKDQTGSFSKVMGRGGMEKAGVSAPPFHPSCRGTCIYTGTTSSGQVPADLAPAAPAPAVDYAPAPAPAPAPAAPEPIDQPPANLPANLHELVRPAPGRTETSEVTTAGTQAELDAAAAKLKAKAIVDAALAKLAAMPSNPGPGGSPGFVDHGLPHQPPDQDGDYTMPFTKGKKGDLTLTKLAGAAKQKPKEMLISSVTLLSPDAPSADIKRAILAKDLPIVLLVKKGGTLYPASMKDQAAIVASALKQEVVLRTRTVDLDKAAAKKPAASAVASPVIPPAPVTLPSIAPPLVPRAPAAAAVSPAKPMGDAANILHQLDGGAKGSNAGGFYTGADGVKRYVKFYDDAAQAHCEHLANTLYSDLGHPAPSSTLFEHKGKVAYASDLFHGGKTLSELGGPSKLSEHDAKAILKGFVGDVLTGNWDAVGLTHDNVMRLPDGRWVRLDNGGTFLMRAKNGRKPDGALNAITEWEVFFSSKNDAYREVAAKAGITSPEDMKGVVVDEIRKVLALRSAAGGWGSYVADRIPDCPVHDRVRVVDMLNARSKLLEEKLAELTAPPKAAPQPGEPRYTARAVGTMGPCADLKPADLESHDALGAWRKEAVKHGAGKMPSGEKVTEYTARAAKAMAEARPDEKAAIVGFTNGTYGEIRDSEEKGKPSKAAQLIASAFGRVPPEPGTVFRGIHIDPANAYKFPAGMTLEERRATVRGMVNQFLTREEWGLGKGGVGATSSSSRSVNVAAENFMGGVDEPNAHAYKVLFKLNAKTAIPIETVSQYESEVELLIGAHARFKTTGVYKLKGYERILVVEADEVEHHKP